MVPAPKKIWSWPTFEGLEAAGGSWGGQRPSGTTRDRRFGQKEPFEPKKISGLDRPLEAAGGSWGGRTPSGTIRDRRLGQKEPFEPKKNSTFADLLRPLEAALEAADLSSYDF